MRLLASLSIATATVAMAGWAHAASPAAGLEMELPAVRDAAFRGNVKAVEAARARFAGHALEAYPRFWLLAAHPERAEPSEIRAFLARYADTPLAEALRRDWLKMLGAAASWEAFRAEHPKLLADDPEITCYSFQERAARGDPEVARESRKLFAAGREAPGACDPVFAALAASGKVGESDAWDRIRRLLAANAVRDAKRTNALLAPRSRLNEKALDRAGSDPAAYLAREKSALASRASKELVVFAVSRLARTKPEVAAERLALFAPRLGAEATAFAWAQVAWQAALAHHPRALEWYAHAADAPLTDTQVAWRARAAMRAGAWMELAAAIQALSPEEAREPTWRYWKARALRGTGDEAGAQALLQGLANQAHFYGILAAEELGVLQPPQWNGWRPQPEDLERVRSLAGVQRALALYRARLDPEAFREWVWALRGFNDRDFLAAAELARLAGLPDRAVNTAERTAQLHDFSQRYPTPHREAIAAAARQWGLDEALMYAIIRQESRFMPEARSRVGATGLMQLMPATARWVARQMRVSPYRPEMLTRPELNVSMGTYYFGRVLEELRHPILATAAYNAGPGRARRWREEAALDGAVYAETIPFNETRDYVKKVMANTWFYRHRLTGQVHSLRQLVGMVPGRNGEPPEAALASIIP